MIQKMNIGQDPWNLINPLKQNYVKMVAIGKLNLYYF